MVCSITLNVGLSSNSSTQSGNIVTRPSGAKASFAGKQPITLRCMEGFRKVLGAEGISKIAAILITNFKMSGSIFNYELTWQKLAS